LLRARKKIKGSIAVFELAAIITGIMVITYISSSFYDATQVKMQAAEGYEYSVKLVNSVIDYYEDNTAYPSSNYNDYGINPGNHTSSITYTDKTVTDHGYVLATFKNESGTHAMIRDKFILLRLEGSGGTEATPNHLVYSCYTNINSSILDGGLQTNNEISQIVGNSCEIITAINDVLPI
jgi:hypothetical protein